MNLELIAKMRKLIAENPDHFNGIYWGNDNGSLEIHLTKRGRIPHVCKTQACFAGFALLAAGKNVEKGVCVSAEAADLLELDFARMSQLFYGCVPIATATEALEFLDDFVKMYEEHS